MSLVKLRNSILVLSILLCSSIGMAVEFNPPKPAPDFTLKSEGGSRSGENFRLQEERGKVILLNFWASWCGPCRKEMPLLNDLQKKYEKMGFTVLGVNVESESQDALDFIAKSPVDFPILLDVENKVSELYNVEAMPSTIIIDRDGNMRTLHHGYKSGYEKLYEEDIKRLVRE